MQILKDFIQEEDGMGVVEIILIIVVLIALVILFRDQITDIVTGILGAIKEDTDEFVAS
ncbi:MAG TPA: Flp1 family type IVb pilin [Lachnospiraceae bacterium]|nr:Flp1 family type IVb pilin [Lachnospiraceae bacterium]